RFFFPMRSRAGKARRSRRCTGRGHSGYYLERRSLMPDESIIHVEKLLKRYGDLVAVDGISFTVRAGEIFAFLGPNRAGKTTTIKMLTTLLKPTSGRITIDGLDPTSDSIGVRRRFGIVFQDPSLDNELTALENLELHASLYAIPRAQRPDRIEQLLKQFE